MLRVLYKSRFSWFVLISLVVIFLWWLKIFITGQKEGSENYWFNIVYGWVALIGSINGLIIAYRKWAGHKSIIGRGIIFLSLGLLGEWFGNTVWGWANVFSHIEIPYPGLADAGFFSVIPLYGLAIIHFAKAAGVKFSLRNFSSQIQAIVIPIIMVAFAWVLFIRSIPFDPSQPLKLFLDYGYPGGEAVTVSIAILTFSLSNKLLGGKMRSRILFVVICLVAQFITDYTFLYSAGKGTYYNAGLPDLFYAISLSLMAFCLNSFKELEGG